MYVWFIRIQKRMHAADCGITVQDMNWIWIGSFLLPLYRSLFPITFSLFFIHIFILFYIARSLAHSLPFIPSAFYTHLKLQHWLDTRTIMTMTLSNKTRTLSKDMERQVVRCISHFCSHSPGFVVFIASNENRRSHSFSCNENLLKSSLLSRCNHVWCIYGVFANAPQVIFLWIKLKNDIFTGFWSA